MLLFFLRGRKDPGILERDRQRIRFSQAGADAMEREQGSAFQELLKYYFQGIEIVKIAE